MPYSAVNPSNDQAVLCGSDANSHRSFGRHLHQEASILLEEVIW
jgi:hypothetical protein